VVAAGGLLNDYFDRDRDAIDKPWRLIPAGRLSPRIALVAGLCSLGIGLWCAIEEAHYTRSELTVYGAAVAGVILYNGIVAYAAVAKGLVVGVLCALPLLFVTGNLGARTMTLCFGTVCFIWGRETLMDVLDVKGDQKAKSLTLPQCCNELQISAVALVIQFVGLFLFIGSITRGPVGQDVIAHVLAVGILCGISYVWFIAPSMRRAGIYLMWVPLILELGLFINRRAN
jgi:4-hydroxybenzoate polyprenyltransferase/geranylgeranylglycerol-phosphate geranylgeranyltransferase